MAIKYLKKSKMYNIFKDNFYPGLLGARSVLGFEGHIDIPKMNRVEYSFFAGAEFIKYYVSFGDDDLVFTLYHCGGFYRFHVDLFDFNAGVNGAWVNVYDNILKSLAV